MSHHAAMDRVTILGLLLSVAIGAHAGDVVLDWNATLRQVVQTDGIVNDPNLANPGWSTRAIAMMNGAIYDAFQAVNRTHDPFLVDVSAPGVSAQAAAAQAAHDILLSTYPLRHEILTNSLNSSLSMVDEGAPKEQGILLGKSIAQQYLANRQGDGADAMMSYTLKDGPGKWRPDPFNPGQVAWGPQYGQVTPFAIGATQPFVDALPSIPELNSSQYTAAWNMVKDYGAIDSAVREEVHEAIGRFWAYDRPAMGPPPVLFVRNLEEIAAAAGVGEQDKARLFALASVAMADAAIAAWDAKFKYDFWRPVTAIHEAGAGGPDDADGNPDTITDPTWRPLGAPGNDPDSMDDDFTPPFPAWTSGHATMGGAVFKAIELFFETNSFEEADARYGDDETTAIYILTSEEAGSGTERPFESFTQVGILDIGTENSPEGENGMSRVYLGIHWIFDQRDGITLGNDIAAFVYGDRFQEIPEPATFTLLGAALVATLRRRRRSA